MAARDANDSRGLGELFACLAMKQRGIELAIGQVSRAAEDDEIERFNLHDACGHVASQCRQKRWLARRAASPRRPAQFYRSRGSTPSLPGDASRGSRSTRFTQHVLEQNLAIARKVIDERQHC